MQAEAVTWSQQVPGRRKCRPLGGAAPMTVFDALEAAELLPLPPTPFVLARWSTATVGPDIHIKVGRTLYSVPWKLIGRKVDVRSTATMVQVFHDGQVVKNHTALDQGKRTDKSDYPPEKIAFQMRTPVWCRSQASEIGDACHEVIDQLLEVNVLPLVPHGLLADSRSARIAGVCRCRNESGSGISVCLTAGLVRWLSRCRSGGPGFPAPTRQRRR
ncbi:hypothetical protein ACFRNJ_18365 [Streptomyces sp. NPDC056721]|uniref:Mu transposase domain-containing protein n=1 Tax=Streptomyces sp. NPDC056721 TaxID=3345923 RepID=UPI0036A86948